MKLMLRWGVDITLPEFVDRSEADALVAQGEISLSDPLVPGRGVLLPPDSKQSHH